MCHRCYILIHKKVYNKTLNDWILSNSNYLWIHYVTNPWFPRDWFVQLIRIVTILFFITAVKTIIIKFCFRPLIFSSLQLYQTFSALQNIIMEEKQAGQWVPAVLRTLNQLQPSATSVQNIVIKKCVVFTVGVLVVSVRKLQAFKQKTSLSV